MAADHQRGRVLREQHQERAVRSARLGAHGRARALYYRKKIRHDRDFHRFSVDTRYFTGRKLDLGLDHHLCHMASAYYCADVEDAIVVSVDGVGDLLSAAIGHGAGKDFRVDARYFQSQQISGQAYEVTTAMLGFHPDKHPGKVTGLAAYVEPPDELVDELDRWFRDQYTRGARENWFYLIHTRDEERQLERLRELRQTKFGSWSGRRSRQRSSTCSSATCWT